MRDVELYQQPLGVVSPWTVDRVELSVKSERVYIWVEHGRSCAGPAPNAGLCCRFTITRRNASGGIGSAANSRPFCVPACRVSRARPTGRGRCDYRGPNRARASTREAALARWKPWHRATTHSSCRR
jgi:hypothetical protein